MRWVTASARSGHGEPVAGRRTATVPGQVPADHCGRVHAPYLNPSSTTKQVGDALERSPRQRSPGLLFAEQKYEDSGGVAGDAELAASGRS